MSILEKLTHQMSSSIESGLSLALHNKNQEVDPLHIVWALLTNTNSLLHQAFNKMNVDKASIELEVKSLVAKLPKVSSVTKESIRLSQKVVTSLQEAEGVMTANGDEYLSVDTWIIANISSDFIVNSMSKYIDLSELKKTLESIRGGKTIDSQSGDESLEALEKY